jgi:hypothetical protein
MRCLNSLFLKQGSLGPCDHMYIPLLCDYVKLVCLMTTVPILLLRSTAVYYDLGTGSRVF